MLRSQGDREVYTINEQLLRMVLLVSAGYWQQCVGLQAAEG